MRVGDGVSGGALRFTANGEIRSNSLIGLNGVGLTSNQDNIYVDHILSNQNIILTAAAGSVQGNNSAAILEALDHVVVDTSGHITVDIVTAGQDIRMTSTAGNIEATELGSGNVIILKAHNDITMQGLAASSNGLSFTATNGAFRSHSDLITRGGLIMDARQGIRVDGDVIALNDIFGGSENGDIVLKNIRSGASVTLHANNLNISENLSAVTNVDARTSGNIYIGQNVIAGGNIHYGLLSAKNDARLESGSSTISLGSQTYVGKDLTVIALTANLNLAPLQSSLRTGGNLNIQASNINMAGGTYAFGGIDFLVSGDVNLVGTKLYAARNQGGTGNIVINAQSLTHNDTTEITAEGSLQLMSRPTVRKQYPV